MTIGKRIRQIRKEQGLTQQEFADKFNLTSATLSNWEQGKNYPNMSHMKMLNEQLGIDLTDFLPSSINFYNLKEKIEKWFEKLGIATGDGTKQLEKLQEEVDELKQAYIEMNRYEEKDAVGDILVVIIGYCLQRGLDLDECLNIAYNNIKDRTGKVVEGMFIKDE